jgi:hypothetical protein
VKNKEMTGNKERFLEAKEEREKSQNRYIRGIGLKKRT